MSIYIVLFQVLPPRVIYFLKQCPPPQTKTACFSFCCCSNIFQFVSPNQLSPVIYFPPHLRIGFQVEYMVRCMKKWGQENGIKI